MINILIYGPPGAGKGTQSEYIKRTFNLVHLSTGDILRNERKAKTKLGIAAEVYINKGELVPDDVVIGMIDHQIKSHKKTNGFIFDGFPRTIIQAEALDRLLNEHNTRLSCVISLEVPENELKNRLKLRATKSARTDDGSLDIIENRIKVYNSETLPLKKYYDKQGKLYSVEGIGNIESIFKKIESIINT